MLLKVIYSPKQLGCEQQEYDRTYNSVDIIKTLIWQNITQAMFYLLRCGPLSVDILKTLIWQNDTRAMFHPLPCGALSVDILKMVI